MLRRVRLVRSSTGCTSSTASFDKLSVFMVSDWLEEREGRSGSSDSWKAVVPRAMDMRARSARDNLARGLVDFIGDGEAFSIELRIWSARFCVGEAEGWMGEMLRSERCVSTTRGSDTTSSGADLVIDG